MGGQAECGVARWRGFWKKRAAANGRVGGGRPSKSNMTTTRRACVDLREGGSAPCVWLCCKYSGDVLPGSYRLLAFVYCRGRRRSEMARHGEHSAAASMAAGRKGEGHSDGDVRCCNGGHALQSSGVGDGVDVALLLLRGAHVISTTQVQQMDA